MIDREIDIPTADGVMNTFITHPEEGGPHTVVLFLMDAPGKREELHDMARRLGSAGYYVMLPNLYYRRLHEFNKETSTREIMFEHMNSLTNAMACEDVRVLMDFTDNEAAARAGKLGCVGYCMSGPFAFAAAAAFPERIAAAASFHGVRLMLDTEDSPHLDAAKVKGELYFGCAEVDEHIPQSMIDALDRHLDDIGANYRIEMYPGTEHGFVFPLRPLYHKVSAERHWERMHALFQRCL
jgi:carboxymethylenebutenolidase